MATSRIAGGCDANRLGLAIAEGRYADYTADFQIPALRAGGVDPKRT